MKKTLIIGFIVLVTLITGMVAVFKRPGSVAEEQALLQGTSEPVKRTIRIIDYFGQEKEIQLPVKRIVALVGPATLQSLHILEATDRVVGVNTVVRESRYLYPRLDDVPIVSNPRSGTVNYEAITALKPDLILAAFWVDKELEKLLGEFTQIIRFDIGRPPTYSQDIRTLATIVGGQRKAEDFIAWYEGFVTKLQKRISTVTEDRYPRVFDYYGNETGLADGPPFGTYGKLNSWVQPLIRMAGGRSITANLDGDWIIVDAEWVVEKNPAVIIREITGKTSGTRIIGYDAASDLHLRDEYNNMLRNPVFMLSDAVKNRRVHFMDCGFIQAQWYLALPYLVRWFHPDLFRDLNPEKYHQEYLTRFLGIDYDLREKGIFVYPES